MKNFTLIMLLLSQLVFVSKSYSQNVAINSTGNLPDASAMLDISSSDKGFLAPRMTTTEQNAILLPATGLLIFNTDSACICQYTGTSWRSQCGSAINTRYTSEWLDSDSLGFPGLGAIYAKQAMESSGVSVLLFDDGAWHHLDPGIVQFSTPKASRINNFFNSTKIADAATGGSYSFSTFNNQIDNTSDAAGDVAGISSSTFLPTSTGRTGATYGANISSIITGSASHNVAYGIQGLLFEGATGGTTSSAYGANLQFYKGGTGNFSNAYGSGNLAWLASGAGGSITNLSGSDNSVSYPNGGTNNVTVNTANAGKYYLGLGPVSGTGSFGTVNGVYLEANISPTTANVVPVTNLNALNIYFTNTVADARVTNAYGILMNDVTRGGTTNYGIYTGLGKISFGDDTEIRSTGYLNLPSGTTAQRPVTPATGMVRYNTSVGVFEGYISAKWVQLAAMYAAATPAATGTISVPMRGVTTYTITPSGNCTFNASSGNAGQFCSFVITTTTTSRTLTWNTNFKTTGTVVTGTTSGLIYTVSFVCTNGTTWVETSRTGPM